MAKSKKDKLFCINGWTTVITFILTIPTVYMCSRPWDNTIWILGLFNVLIILMSVYFVVYQTIMEDK